MGETQLVSVQSSLDVGSLTFASRAPSGVWVALCPFQLLLRELQEATPPGVLKPLSIAAAGESWSLFQYGSPFVKIHSDESDGNWSHRLKSNLKEYQQSIGSCY